MHGSGGTKSFADIVPLYASAMLRVAAALVGPAEAEDAVQEASMRAWQSWPTLRNVDAVRPWLLRITLNVCRQWRRGLKVFLVTADGELVANPRHYRNAEQQLAKANKRVSRRKKGSNRRKKAVRLLAKKQQHGRRQRTDFHHKTALTLVRTYDVVYYEAIQPANLSRRPAPVPDGNGGYLQNGAGRKAGLNKSIHDAGWGQFLAILAYKAAWAGKRAEAVSPAYTSQHCSGCGERVKKSLSVRTHIFPSCGLILDRDANAARTSQWRGQRLRGVAGL